MLRPCLVNYFTDEVHVLSFVQILISLIFLGKVMKEIFIHARYTPASSAGGISFLNHVVLH